MEPSISALVEALRDDAACMVATTRLTTGGSAARLPATALITAVELEIARRVAAIETVPSSWSLGIT